MCEQICPMCDKKISLRGLAQHVVEEHCHGKEFKVDSFGDRFRIRSKLSRKAQYVFLVKGNDCHKFLENWCSLDNNSTLFWVAYIGQKDLASNFRYTLQVESKDEAKKDVFEGTRNCIPCDLSHTDVKEKKCAFLLDKGLIDDATKEDGKFHYNLTIHKS